MPVIYNATEEVQSVKAHGNHFTFKPKQIKLVHSDSLAQFLTIERGDHGLVSLSDKFEDPEYKLSDEGKAELAAAEEKGINAYVNKLRLLIKNNQVSLRRDLERANIKIDPSSEISDGELEAMRTVAKYQKKKEDAAQKRMEEVKELTKKIGNLK